MNIAEIRQKYPQYNDLSDEQLAKGLHQKYYANMPFDDFSQRIGLSTIPQITDEQRKIIQDRNKAYEDKQKNASFDWETFAEGFLEGAPLGAEKVADAVSLGIYGKLNKLLGGNFQERSDKIDSLAKSADIEGLNRTVNKSLDAAGTTLGLGVVGNPLKALGWLGKGERLASKAARAIFIPGKGAVTAAASGGALEGTINPESTAGKIGANIVGGMLGGAAANIGNRTYQTLKGGLENIVENNDALRLVRRGATIDDDIAQAVTRDATEAAGNINRKSVKALADVLDGVDARTRYKDVRKAYQTFVDANKGKKVRSWENLPKLNNFQQKQYNKALKEGLDMADYGTREGTLGHMLEARGLIDDAINKSYIQEFPGKKATKKTGKLVDLKEKLDRVLAKDSAVKGSDRNFELYKQFENMYQRGLQYQPGSAKNVMNEILLEAGGDAEKAMMSRIGLRKGLFDKMTVNVTPEQNFSKTAKNYQNVLKEVNYEPDYKDLIDKLSKNENAYSRLASLANRAENKLVTPEGTRFFGREQLESGGAAKGAILDYILGRLNSGYYKDAAQRLLNSNGEAVDILTSPLYQQVIGNILTGSVKGGGNNIRTMLAQDIARELLGENDGQDKKSK